MSATGLLVYVVDDDQFAREGISGLIRSAGMKVRMFASGQEFLADSRTEEPVCLVLDVNLPGLGGLEVQKELAKSGAQIPIIFLTGYGDIPTAVRAVKAGAAEFLTKPFDDEDLLNAIRRCIPSDQKEIRSEMNFGQIIGTSPALKRVLDMVKTVAPSDSTVLLTGETGTGKELIAGAIHDLSSRSKRPFIKVNCAAIPATLLESELFGHEKGSFTGAYAQKIGRFEMAHHGTLFLDEVGEIPLELQPKLLRVLQEQELERVGGSKTIRVDVRIVAATNRDLKQMVDEGRFRSDLYYRLLVFPLEIPPLRQRRQDIPPLIRFFTDKYAKKMNRVIEEIPSGVLEALTVYNWPGNVRELQNMVERSVILSPGRVLQMQVPDVIRESGSPAELDDNLERERILEALRLAGGRISGAGGAAERLGLKRTTLQFRMKKLNIERQYQ